MIDTEAMRGRVASVGRSALRSLMRSPFQGLQGKGVVVEQLLLSPRDLRTADPSFATEIYHHQFGLAGTVAMTGSESPFTVRPPSPAWERQLHGFGWLRHLSAAGDEISREHARALVGDWLQLHAKAGGPMWEPELVGRRVISWLSHSRIFLEGAEQRFYEDVMEGLTRQIRYLYARHADADPGQPHLTALAALVFAELCTEESFSGTSGAVRLFTEELDRQILSDGGHISRNPMALIDILLDLLPLRQCFVARDRPPPAALIGAIDRIMPMIRFFRLGDGGLTRFNGGTATPTDNLASVIAHDDAQGAPLVLAQQSGYCRLAHGETILIIDCGHPPPPAVSQRAHAGCLGIEMSVGRYPVIINCGAPARSNVDWRQAARATAAHSALVMSDTSSAQMRSAGTSVFGQDEYTISGPANVMAKLDDVDGVQTLRASHDGYDSRFGITHTRRLGLSASGDTLTGEDMLIAPHGLKSAAKSSLGAFAIRFHLHPSVKSELSSDQRTAFLTLPNGQKWRFSSRSGGLTLEESVYLADNRGPRRTMQIVLYGQLGEAPEIKTDWILERGGD